MSSLDGCVHHENDLELPFAVKYSGPLTAGIPRISPVDFVGIPVASYDDSFSDTEDSCVPVVHPIAESGETSTQISGEPSCYSCESTIAEHDNFEGYMIPHNVNSIESTPSSDSSETFSSVDEDRPQTRVVTFLDHGSGEDEEITYCEKPLQDEIIAARPGKKGTCYLCMKGTKFTEKEECLVCGAKYCLKCVIRAMGSMPEGRKCLSCIGKSVSQRSRNRLGKSSRMLKRVLHEVELKKIMERERILEPGLISVNLHVLSQQELLVLLNCRYPPRNLKHGDYWYDKDSGMWGKVGKRPHQIISPQLAVGGFLQKDASNGNTNVLVNGREITKPELIMLQAAGVNCEGMTSLWVNADGTYRDEGMGNIKGRIWDSNKARVACILLQLPLPPSPFSGYDETVVGSTPTDKKMLYKILMVGGEHSGSTTIFKQARMIHKVSFSAEERQAIKFRIQLNLYRYLAIVCKAGEQFEREIFAEMKDRDDEDDGIIEEEKTTIYSIDPTLKDFSKQLQEAMIAGKLESIVPVDAALVNKLWHDRAFQAIYQRRQEIFSITSSAPYFLRQAPEIARSDYDPSSRDILLEEGTTNKELSAMEFSFPKVNTEDSTREPKIYDYSPFSRYLLVRTHPTILGDNCKRLQMFEDVDIAVFCVSLIDYGETSVDSSGFEVNKMMANKVLFESFVNHPALKDKKFLLVLNKFDLLEAKLRAVPLDFCEWFHDYHPVVSNGGQGNGNGRAASDHRAFLFIAVKFKRLFQELTGDKLYVSQTTGLEAKQVDEMLRYARDVIKWEEEKPNYQNHETSSIDEYTFS